MSPFRSVGHNILLSIPCNLSCFKAVKPLQLLKNVNTNMTLLLLKICITIYSKMLLTYILKKLYCWIISRNVKNFVACETLIGIMMGHLEFSFAPFGRDIKEESKFFRQTFRCIWYWKPITIFRRNQQQHCQRYNQCRRLPSSKYSLQRY